MSIRLSNLSQSDGNLTYTNKDINLEPTGRQLVYGLSYRKDLDNDISFSIKHTITSNLNHNQDADVVSASFVGVRYKDLKVGLTKKSVDSSINSEFSYLMLF